jgi:hypothetical protein
MPSQTIIWTALPHGIREDGSTVVRRLSVFVSPRLFTDDAGPAPLDAANFPDFAKWPARNPLDIEFGVWLRTGPGDSERQIATVKPVSSNLWTDGWNALFEDVVVRSFQMDDLSDRAHATFDATALHEGIMRQYQQSAVLDMADQSSARSSGPNLNPFSPREIIGSASAANAPPLSWQSPDGRRFRVLSLNDALNHARERLQAREQAAASNPSAGIRDAIRVSPIVSESDDEQESVADGLGQPLAYHLANFAAFHGHATSRRSSHVHIQQSSDEREFHDILAKIGNHPILLSRFGLVLPLKLTEDLGPTSGTAWIRVEPVSGWNPKTETAPPGSPWTAFDPDTFWPVPRSQRALGSARVSPPGFVVSPSSGTTGRLDLVQIDLEGAAHKNPVALDAVTPPPAGVPNATPQSAGPLPFLRAGGLSVIRRGQSDLLADSVGSARDHDTRLAQPADERVANDDALGAEDLNRGYRLDIFDARTRRWQSLHQRSISYVLRGSGLEWTSPGPVTGNLAEGLTQLGVTVPDGDDPRLLLVNDTLAWWDGWSLSVPRPGLSIGQAGDAVQVDQPAEIPGIHVNQQVTPGSLPRLRFGGQYRLRIRTVDLAGNSLSLDEAEDAGLDVAVPSPNREPFTYRRFEPVNSPVLVMRQAFVLGDAPERIVLRSDFQVDAPVYAERHKDFALAHERIVAPPRAAQTVVEQSGNLDASFGPDAAAQGQTSGTYDIAARDSAAFTAKDQTGNETEIGNAVTDVATPMVPHLPDPFSLGAAFRFRNGDSATTSGEWATINARDQLEYRPEAGVRDSVIQIRYASRDNSWPDLKTFRIRLQQADAFAKPEWDPTQRVLILRLPQGEQLTVPLSSYLAGTTSDFAKLGLWQWMLDLIRDPPPGLSDDVLAAIKSFNSGPGTEEVWLKRAASGEIGFLTPARDLTLVHAVQRPAREPVLDPFAPQRNLGETFVRFQNVVRVHAQSTAKIELLANWREIVDRIQEAAPRTIETSTRIVEQHILAPTGQGDENNTAAAWANKSALTLIAGGALEQNGRRVLVSGTRAPEQATQGTSLLQHEFGDTKHRNVTYRLVGTSRFPEYFPPDSVVTLDGKRIPEITVPSSARPAPPSVQYAIPSFRWRRTGDLPAEQTRERWGGVRVFLDRPWFSSGEGERLGVVLWAPSDGSWPPPLAVAPLVTRWGADPIWTMSTPELAPPTLASFPGSIAAESRTGLSVPGVEGSTPAIGANFAVAPHEVFYDSERMRWFADIQIDASSHYFPFVRLALARYQPESVTNAHLSAVVAAEIIQFTPYRSVTMTPSPSDPDLMTVIVSGPAGGQSLSPITAEHHSPNEIVVRLEKRLAGTDDDLGWVAATWPGSVPDPTAQELWHGLIRLPAERPEGTYRLVIQEFDHLSRDDPDAGYPEMRRLVYAETITL